MTNIKNKVYIFDYNDCGLTCKCGANIKIGGRKEDIDKVRVFLKGEFECEDKTDYSEKISNNKF